jgi:hypothetical protein
MTLFGERSPAHQVHGDRQAASGSALYENRWQCLDGLALLLHDLGS